MARKPQLFTTELIFSAQGPVYFLSTNSLNLPFVLGKLKNQSINKFGEALKLFQIKNILLILFSDLQSTL